MAKRSQQHRIDWFEGADSWESLNFKLSDAFTKIDDLFQVLFVDDEDDASIQTSLALLAAQVSLLGIGAGIRVFDTSGIDGIGPQDGQDGIPGLRGAQGIQGATGLGIPGQDGDDAEPFWPLLPPSTPSVAKVDIYNNIATAGWGIPAVYGFGRSTAQTAAVASVATYTVGPADGTFIISANVNVTTSTLHNFTVTCAYTDETGAARTLTLTFSQLAGTLVTAITNVTGAGPYEGIPLQIRCQAATAITIASTGTFTTVTYNIEGSIIQIA